MFNYDQAKAICAAHGSRLATIEEMINAYNNLINMLYAENPSRKTAELIVR